MFPTGVPINRSFCLDGQEISFSGFHRQLWEKYRKILLSDIKEIIDQVGQGSLKVSKSTDKIFSYQTIIKNSHIRIQIFSAPHYHITHSSAKIRFTSVSKNYKIFHQLLLKIEKRILDLSLPWTYYYSEIALDFFNRTFWEQTIKTFRENTRLCNSHFNYWKNYKLEPGFHIPKNSTTTGYLGSNRKDVISWKWYIRPEAFRIECGLRSRILTHLHIKSFADLLNRIEKWESVTTILNSRERNTPTSISEFTPLPDQINKVSVYFKLGSSNIENFNSENTDLPSSLSFPILGLPSSTAPFQPLDVFTFENCPYPIPRFWSRVHYPIPPPGTYPPSLAPQIDSKQSYNKPEHPPVQTNNISPRRSQEGFYVSQQSSTNPSFFFSNPPSLDAKLVSIPISSVFSLDDGEVEESKYLYFGKKPPSLQLENKIYAWLEKPTILGKPKLDTSQIMEKPQMNQESKLEKAMSALIRDRDKILFHPLSSHVPISKLVDLKSPKSEFKTSYKTRDGLVEIHRCLSGGDAILERNMSCTRNAIALSIGRAIALNKRKEKIPEYKEENKKIRKSIVYQLPLTPISPKKYQKPKSTFINDKYIEDSEDLRNLKFQEIVGTWIWPVPWNYTSKQRKVLEKSRKMADLACADYNDWVASIYKAVGNNKIRVTHLCSAWADLQYRTWRDGRLSYPENKGSWINQKMEMSKREPKASHTRINKRKSKWDILKDFEKKIEEQSD
jgi:hypothetical protein